MSGRTTKVVVMTEREKSMLLRGIEIGLACSAGMAPAFEGMTPMQIGAALESIAENRTAVETIWTVAVEDALAGVQHTPDSWTGMMRHLAAKATGKEQP